MTAPCASVNSGLDIVPHGHRGSGDGANRQYDVVTDLPVMDEDHVQSYFLRNPDRPRDARRDRIIVEALG
jgi:hypothetical protein